VARWTPVVLPAPWVIMERETGIEPVTSSLGSYSQPFGQR